MNASRYARDPRTIVLCNALRHAHSALTFGVSDEQRAEIAKTIEIALAPYVTDAAPTQKVIPVADACPECGDQNCFESGR